MKKQQLLSGGIVKTYISYLIPTIIGMLTNSVYCIVDVMFVGVCIGSDGLAAFNIAMPIFTIYSSVGLMLGVGGATTISVLVGQGDQKNVNKIFSFTVYTSMAIGLIMSIAGLVFLEPFAVMLGATPDLVPAVMEYLFPLQCVAMLYILNGTMQVLIRADYNPKIVMLAAILANATNILFDWIFVSVLDYGLIGASTATAFGPCVAIIVLSFHYIKKKNTMKFTLHCFAKGLISKVFKNGAGTFILEFTSGAVVFLFNLVLLRVSGPTAVAVYAIISNVAYVGKGIFNGISQAAQPLLSVNFGAENFDRIKRTLKVALVTAIGFSATIYGLILLFPNQIISIFIRDGKELMSLGADASRIYFIAFIFTGINTVLMYYFQSLENLKTTSLIALCRGIIFISIGLIIFPPLFGEVGVWITAGFAEIVTLLLTLPIKKRFDSITQNRFNLSPKLEYKN